MLNPSLVDYYLSSLLNIKMSYSKSGKVLSSKELNRYVVEEEKKYYAT